MPVVRVSFADYEDGEQYRVRLTEEANRIFQVFLSLLSSYWQSTIDGPAYAREIKAISIELARIRLSLEDVRTDVSYASTRTDFIYQVMTSVMFPPNTEVPNPGLADEDFRTFLNDLLGIYYQGSVPDSMVQATELLTSGQVKLTEAFLEARKPGSGFDISDQFGFLVDVVLDTGESIDVLLTDKNVRILLDIIRPAHTLLRLKYVLQDDYTGNQDPDPINQQPNKVLDSFSWILTNYGYEDFRKFVLGMKGLDYLGFKGSKAVVLEDHSMDF